MVCFADGVVVERTEWDGRTYGYGRAGLVEHQLFGGAGECEAAGAEGGVRMWSLYAHLDEFDEGFVAGARLAAGQRIGACGKSGGQTWAHLHFDLRYKGPPEMGLVYWGGRLSYEAQSNRYADPYTLLRVLEGIETGGAAAGLGEERRLREEYMARAAAGAGELAVVTADRDFNYRLKMAFEGQLRELEGKRRLRRGTTDRLIAV